MPRTLRYSARPFIALGALYGVFVLLTLSLYWLGERRIEQLQPAGVLVGLYVATMAMICSVRITVSGDGLVIRRSWFLSRQSIRFEDVDHSIAQCLAERDWPVMLTIHARGRRQPLARVGLKAIRKDDAAWLCSLPQLKVATRPGLT